LETSNQTAHEDHSPTADHVACTTSLHKVLGRGYTYGAESPALAWIMAQGSQTVKRPGCTNHHPGAIAAHVSVRSGLRALQHNPHTVSGAFNCLASLLRVVRHERWELDHQRNGHWWRFERRGERRRALARRARQATRSPWIEMDLQTDGP